MNFNINSIKQHIPHVETINQNLSGNIEITYIDGHVLCFNPHQEYKGFAYTTNECTKSYSQYDIMPSIVRERFDYIPLLSKIISNANNNFKTPSNINGKCIR